MNQSRPTGVHSEEEPSFFEKERDRLVTQIASAFEDVISQSNVLNRQTEQVYGVGRDFQTVEALWGRFKDLMKEQQAEVHVAATDPQGMPGTGTALAGRASVIGRDERQQTGR
ncbi:hypothetical protein FRB96_001514 [Tulasnella sp. 330]|nr:hypothetical protein FRB96_001514 [Tulasnella sp. 330]KAG8890691.1 hypothetical protein FRB98_006195 [Tulasnella sp. 332]